MPVLVVTEPAGGARRPRRPALRRPRARLRLLAVTGTQGKTTTTRLAEAALQAAGSPPRSSAPSAPGSPARTCTTALTTPEAPDLHALFAVMRERGVAGVRDGGLQPRAGDGPGRRRGLRRRRLHQPRPRPPRLPRRRRGLLRGQGDAVHPRAGRGSALVNVDDAYGRRLAAEADDPGAHVLRRGRRRGLAGRRRRGRRRTGSPFTVRGPGGRAVRREVPLPGDFNVANALCAVAGLGRGRVRRRRGGRRRCAASPASRAGWSASTPGQDVPRGRRLRPQAGRRRGGAAQPAAADRRAG